MKAVCCMIAAVAIVAMANTDLPEEVMDLSLAESLGGVAQGVVPAKEAKQALVEEVGAVSEKAAAKVGVEDGLAAVEAQQLVQVAEGAAGRRRRRSRVRSFTVKFSLINGGGAVMALSRHRTPQKGPKRSYEITIADDGKVCIAEGIGIKAKACGQLGNDGRLLWTKGKNDAESKSGSKMWSRRHKYSTNLQVTRDRKGKITVYVMTGTKKKEVVSHKASHMIDARYISVATAEDSPGSWTVCSYRCVRGIYTTAGTGKVWKAAGHLERYMSQPWSYWRSEFFPEINENFGVTKGVDFSAPGRAAGKTLVQRVVDHVNSRTPWTKINGYKFRIHTLSFSGSSKVWQALAEYKYNPGEQLGAKGASHLYTSKWAATFESKMRIPKTETYIVYTWADDGARVSVDGVTAHESTGIQNDMKWASSSKSISAGTRKMRVDYYQNAGVQGLWVMWSTATDAGAKGKCGSSKLNQKTCSKSFLSAPARIGGGVGPTNFRKCRRYGGSLTVRAWAHIGKPKTVHQAMQFTQKKPTKVFLATSIFFEKTRSYFQGLDAHFTKEFAMRVDGFFKAKVEGTYKFWLVSADGSQLWIDNRSYLNENIPVAVDNDGEHAIQGIAPWQEKMKSIVLRKGYFRISAMMFSGSGSKSGNQHDFELYVQTPTDNGPRNVNCRDFTKSPLEATARYAYVGCYADSTGGKRDLPIRKSQTGVGLKSCNNFCAGYRYFGRQGNRECWCGNSYGTKTIPAGAKDYPKKKTNVVNYNPKNCDCRARGMKVKGRQCVYERIIAGSKNLAFGKRASASNAPKPTAAWRAVDGFTNHGIMNNADGGMADSRSMACAIIKPSAGKSSWWRVDFGDTRRVSSFSITGASDGEAAMSSGLTARVGGWMNNGKSDAPCARSVNGYRGTHFKKCSAPLSGRYFSLWGMGDSQMVICEVQVYGDQADLAMNKKTSQSNTAEGGVSKRAVDGNTDSKFANGSCTHTGAASFPWWRVDLGATATVDTVTIFNRGDCCFQRLNKFEVRVGNNGGNYRGNSKCGNFHSFRRRKVSSKSIACGKKSGRYVFVDIPSAKATLTLCEVKVTGSHSVENLSKGKPCAQSSNASCGKALDGNINGDFSKGSCSATSKEDPAWWYVDLQDEFHISEVHVFGRTDCCGDRLSNFQVRVGDIRPTSGSYKMNKACGSATNGGKNDYNQFNIQNPAKPSMIVKCANSLGQYVSINVPDRREQLTLCEVQVYGRKSGKVRPNIAQGKKATQSTTGHGGKASRAVDGNTASRYGSGSCTHTNKSSKTWWQVDLGKTFEVRKVVVYNRSDCCQSRLNNFQVRVGDFSGSPTAIAKNTKCGSAVSSTKAENIVMCPRENRSRFVSVDLFTRSDVLTLCEVKVYGNVINDGMALNKPTGQSSTANGGYSKRAVDGNTEGSFKKGSCTATMKSTNPWWYVDLGKKASVKKVRIYNRSDCCGDRIRNLEVRVGNTRPSSVAFSSNPKCGGLHWSDAAAKGGGSLVVPCTGIVGQFVSIVLPGKKRLLSICEVKVSGEYVTKAYSQCQTKMKGVAAELMRAQQQYKKISKDMGALNGDHSKIKKDLNSAKMSEKKAKMDVLAARGAGATALKKAQKAHNDKLKAKDKAAQDMKTQISLEKKATARQAGKAADAAKAHAATHKKCTSERLKNAAEMNALKKGSSRKDALCVKTAKAEKKVMDKKYGDLNRKHQAHKSAAASERDRAANELSSMRKQCKQKQADARDAGRKAGLKACPGVNGLMREIWRLRQKLGKAAARL